MNGRSLMALGLAAAAATAVQAGPEAAGSRFDQVFSARGEPAALHYRATYTAHGATHRLEVWRDGDRRLVRRTDDAIETHVARPGDGAAYQMVVLDLRRKIETRVTRDDLYRIGNFTDWFDLAHGLRHPKAGYTLTALPATEAPKLATTVPCRWVVLAQGAVETHICWSESVHLPIAMLDGGGKTLWQVDAVSQSKIPGDIFEVHDQGFVRNDASRDISGD